MHLVSPPSGDLTTKMGESTTSATASDEKPAAINRWQTDIRSPSPTSSLDENDATGGTDDEAELDGNTARGKRDRLWFEASLVNSWLHRGTDVTFCGNSLICPVGKTSRKCRSIRLPLRQRTSESSSSTDLLPRWAYHRTHPGMVTQLDRGSRLRLKELVAISDHCWRTESNLMFLPQNDRPPRNPLLHFKPTTPFPQPTKHLHLIQVFQGL